jgi:hypothetical protein
MGEGRGAFRVLVRKLKERDNVEERPGQKLEDNIKMDLQKVGW